MEHERAGALMAAPPGSAGQPPRDTRPGLRARWRARPPIYSPALWALMIALDVLPWLQAMAPPDGRAAAFVCRDLACQAPIADIESLDRTLADIAAPRRIV